MKDSQNSLLLNAPETAERKRRRFPWYNTVTMLLAVGGILFGVFAYLSSRAEKEPCFASQSTSLVSSQGSGIPGVQIRFRGKAVRQLTSTNVYFWNAGKRTIEGGDVASADRLRVVLLPGAELLSARVVKVTRWALVPTAQIVDGSASLSFDFLDRGDGFVLQLLHTGEEGGTVRVVGTVKGATAVKEVFAQETPEALTINVLTWTLAVGMLAWLILGFTRWRTVLMERHFATVLWVAFLLPLLIGLGTYLAFNILTIAIPASLR